MFHFFALRRPGRHSLSACSLRVFRLPVREFRACVAPVFALLVPGITGAWSQAALPVTPPGSAPGSSPQGQTAPQTTGPHPGTLLQLEPTPIPLNRRTIPAVRVNTPPVIDGDLSDPVWQQAAHQGHFTDDTSLQPVPDQTEVFLAYDSRNVYVAFHAYDSHPEGVIGRTVQRDVQFSGEDRFSFTIDPFKTHQFQDRSFFSINPLGTEYTHLAGGRGAKLEWEGAWRAAARIVKDGWTGEMAIPWAILNYPSVRGPVTVGVNFDRFQQRTNTHSWWSNLEQPEQDALDGLWVGVLLPPFHPRVSYLPYVSPSFSSGGVQLRKGLDVRGAISPTMTMVGTLEPDFQNVEQAVESVTFSYGERFVPDLRPFFLEGQNLYRSGSAAGRYFYTQRIPAFDLGANLYGNIDPADTIGALAAVSFGQRADWIFRGRHEFGPAISVDTAFINRDEPDLHNRVLVVGQNYQKKSWNDNISYAGSWTNDRFQGGVTNGNVEYDTPHTFTGLGLYAVQPGFSDLLGFIPFTNYEGLNPYTGFNYAWHKGTLRSLNTYSQLQLDDHYGGAVFRRRGLVDVSVTAANNQSVDLNWNGGRFEQFYDSVYSVSWIWNTYDSFHTFGVGYSLGEEGGAYTHLLTPSATWRFGRKLTLGLASTIQMHQGYIQQNILTFNYDFSRARGIVGRVVAQTGGTNGYLAYRHSGYGGTEFWLILGDPNALSFKPRLAAKVVWAL